MSINVRIRNGMMPDDYGEGGASEGDVRGSHSDIIESTGGVVDKSGGHALVHEATGTPNMTVEVDDGVVYIPNAQWDQFDSDSVKFWEAVIENEDALVISSNTSGQTRYDLICAKLNPSTEPNEYASNISELIVIEGSPGGIVPSTPDNHEALASVEVADGATEIEDTDITDLRRQILLKKSFININPPQGFMLNGKIVPSVSSNNLTLALKTLSGNDPSANDPIYVRIADTVHSITNALSVTANAGTNWLNMGVDELATQEVDLFAYLGYNETDGVVIGFGRIPYAKRYEDFSETTTNDSHCIISDISNADSNDAYEVVGRFAAILSAASSYNWSVPTYTTENLIQQPILETRVLTYEPQRGAALPMTVVSDEFQIGTYRVRGRVLEIIEFVVIGQFGGSAINSHYITLPFNVRAASVIYSPVIYGEFTYTPTNIGLCSITNNTNVMGVKKSGGGNWSLASSTGIWSAPGPFEIHGA